MWWLFVPSVLHRHVTGDQWSQKGMREAGIPQELWLYNVREGGGRKVQSGKEQQEEDRDNKGVVTVTQRGVDEVIMQESRNPRQSHSRKGTGKSGNPSILCCDCQDHHRVCNDSESYTYKLCFGHWRRKTISWHIYPFNTEGKFTQEEFWRMIIFCSTAFKKDVLLKWSKF